METIVHPNGTPVDRLIAEFSKKNDISYLYETHEIQSRFETHKNKKD